MDQTTLLTYLTEKSISASSVAECIPEEHPSACKEEVSMYRPNSPESSGACAFTLHYVQVLAKGNFSCWGTTLTTRLSATISQVESLLQEGSMEPSSFVTQVKQTLNQAGILSTAPLFFKKLADTFSLGQFTLRSKITHVSAELVIPGYGSHHPLPFIPGLPVAIPVDITLHNISSEGRLWLSLTSDDGQLTQFLFLDPNLQVVSVGAKMKKKISMPAPFYGPPKVLNSARREYFPRGLSDNIAKLAIRRARC
ncbi:unnamed protein product [Linum tenue]|uniref:Integrator complex subunit 4/Protein SIEL C-terminal Ig-like domain-containing protein n=1 Tax=Linum tenue TaxID=586396 RepID=A0AAV0KQ05_9ROSI|nr:unnamed protein product [Linum tenue]